MRVLEARFHEGQRGAQRGLQVARLYCDGPRVEVESLLDADSLLSRLMLIARACGPDPFAELASGRRDGAGWSFVAIDADPSCDDPGPAPGAAFDSLSFVLPMWNEADNILPSVDAARQLGDELCAEGTIRAFEIVIVDDHSTDATGAMADRLVRQDGRLRVIHNERNHGLGGSLRAGFAAARGELVLYTDADLPCDIGEARKALRLLRLYNAELVTAHRRHRIGEGLLRALYSAGYNWLVRRLFGLRLLDVNFAFKLFRRRILEQVRLASDGSFVDAELLARAHRLGMRIIQFGVDYVPRIRGASTLARPAVIANILVELGRLYPQIVSLRPAASPVVELRREPPRQLKRGAASG
jgi:GT2 family glycosyltransferase